MNFGYGIIDHTPCPWCGNQARVVHSGVGWYVSCPHCDRFTYTTSSEETAREAWNKRYMMENGRYERKTDG